MHWSSAFVGLPFADRGRTMAGADCWGLVFLAFASRGMEVPRYDEGYLTIAERAEIAAIMSGAALGSPWIEVAQEREWDVAVFRRAGIDAHVGIVVEPGRMLHVSKGQTARIETYRDGRWKPRLSGFYRHEALA